MSPTLLRLAHLALSLTLLLAWPVQAQTPAIGVVVMHGKGGAPTKFVAELAAALQARGMQVANLEMPWSARRGYDVSVAAAEAEVDAALGSMRAKGATKLFVAGHSQGGIFALHFAGGHAVDGVVAIAPGGNVGSTVFHDKLGDMLAVARKAVDEGKGAESLRLADYEGGKGVYPVFTTPANYVQWFEPEGAMNQVRAIKAIPATTPVLYIAPTNDYPALVRANGALFAMLPAHAKTQLLEPASSHLNAPTASAAAIGDWLSAVATSP